MSNFNSLTRHPVTGIFEIADWLDDHFGKHRYGVKFPSDGLIFPEEEVSAAAMEWMVMNRRRPTSPTNQPTDP
jgi:hypothetical protein